MGKNTTMGENTMGKSIKVETVKLAYDNKTSRRVPVLFRCGDFALTHTYYQDGTIYSEYCVQHIPSGMKVGIPTPRLNDFDLALYLCNELGTHHYTSKWDGKYKTQEYVREVKEVCRLAISRWFGVA